MRVGAIQDNIVESFPLVAHSVLLEELDERMIRIFHACFLDHLARYIDSYDLAGFVRQQVTFQYPRAATDIEDASVPPQVGTIQYRPDFFRIMYADSVPAFRHRIKKSLYLIHDNCPSHRKQSLNRDCSLKWVGFSNKPNTDDPEPDMAAYKAPPSYKVSLIRSITGCFGNTLRSKSFTIRSFHSDTGSRMISFKEVSGVAGVTI